MDFHISGTTVGDDKIVSQLGVVVEDGSDFRPAWTPVHKILIKGVRFEFRTEGQGSGGWMKLNPKYRRQKRKRYGNKTILRREDELWKSLTDPNHDNHIFIPARQHMSFGSADPNAARHHFGIPSINLPSRKMVVLTDNMRRDILKELQSHIFKRLNYTPGS